MALNFKLSHYPEAGSFSVRMGVAYWGEKEPKGCVPRGVWRAQHAPHAPKPLAQVVPDETICRSVT